MGTRPQDGHGAGSDVSIFLSLSSGAQRRLMCGELSDLTMAAIPARALVTASDDGEGHAVTMPTFFRHVPSCTASVRYSRHVNRTTPA